VQLRCPDEVYGDIWIWSTGRGLKINSTNYPDHGHYGDPHVSGKNLMVEAGIEPGTS
jgi:hypothetical protein